MKTNIFFFLLSILIAKTNVISQETPAFKVEVHGSGPAMYLLPGAACSGEVWQATVKKYRSTHRLHVFTLAGYAGITPLASDSILPVLKDSLTAYIKQTKTENSILMGHSVGGFLAMWMAAENKQLVDKLIIVDALPFLAGASAPQMTEAVAKNAYSMMKTYFTSLDSTSFAITQNMTIKSMLKNEDFLEALIGQSMRSDRRTLGTTMYELMSTDLRDDVSEIEVPGLVLTGWMDEINSTENEKLNEKLNIYKDQYHQWKSATLVVVENASHFIMLDNANAFFAEIDAFIANLD